MKLWSKVYLITVGLFLPVLCSLLLAITPPAVSARLTTVREAGLDEVYAISRSPDNAFSAEGLDRRQSAATFGDYYAARGVGLYVGSEQETLYDSLPFPIDLPCGKLQFIWHGGDCCLCIADALRTGCTLLYCKPVTDAVNACQKSILLALAAGTAALIALCVLIYLLLRRINRPMERLAHELKTPLTAISGYAQMIQLTAMNDEQRYNATQYIIEESGRLSAITNKLLTLADLRDGAVEREPLSVEELFSTAAETYPRVRFDAAGQRVYGDKALLKSLINNLVANALKASDEDGVVELRAEKGVITVTDHGTGMDKKQLAYVNHPTETENPKQRSGFGVPLCHEIARLHKASLHFSSELGVGTTATLRTVSSCSG